MPNGRCKVHGGKSTGAADAAGVRAQQPSKLEARLLLARSQGGPSAVRAAMLALRYLFANKAQVKLYDLVM
jgi:hypothetical protein